MKMLNERQTIAKNHPELIPFLKETFGTDINKGTLIEIKVKKPGQEDATTTIDVQESELSLFRKVQDIVNDIS